MLNAAQIIASENVPVLGVNRGRLGFLTDVLPDEIEQKIAEVLAGHYTMESRFLLQLDAIHQGERRSVGCALNDVVLHPGKAAQMIEFELYVDDSFVYSQESDGLIVATPTGSTAYAMSAGGPIMHPRLDAIALVPICPHSLSSRPIVVSGDSEVRLVIGSKESILPKVSCDGEVKFSAVPGDQLIIRKKSTALQLIHPPEHSFYEAYRSKLGWGSRLEKKDD
jgi:NAD+ kinase